MIDRFPMIDPSYNNHSYPLESSMCKYDGRVQRRPVLFVITFQSCLSGCTCFGVFNYLTSFQLSEISPHLTPVPWFSASWSSSLSVTLARLGSHNNRRSQASRKPAAIVMIPSFTIPLFTTPFNPSDSSFAHLHTVSVLRQTREGCANVNLLVLPASLCSRGVSPRGAFVTLQLAVEGGDERHGRFQAARVSSSEEAEAKEDVWRRGIEYSQGRTGARGGGQGEGGRKDLDSLNRTV